MLRINNTNRIIIGQININSIRSKFHDLVKEVRSNIDILLISKTKLDASFPTSQYLINGYSFRYRLDRNDIPSKLITANLPNIEGFFLEINLRKKKWVISCSNNTHNKTIFSHIESTSRSSHPEVFLEKGVLKICSKFTGEHPCRSVKSDFGMGVLL